MEIPNVPPQPLLVQVRMLSLRQPPLNETLELSDESLESCGRPLLVERDGHLEYIVKKV